MTEIISTIYEELCGSKAKITLTYELYIIREINGFSAIKGVKRAFPKSFIAVLLSITNYATVNLVNLVKSSFLHHSCKNFATYAAGAISDHSFLLEMIVFRSEEHTSELQSH